jgi:ATPase subunit of ABC transporter with duplicated ATPase domains
MHKNCTSAISDVSPLLTLTNISLSTPSGRPLFHDLNMVLDHEKVAIIGRNGVGKTSLLNIIKGHLQPNTGKVSYGTKPYLVPQQIDSEDSDYLRNLLNLLPEEYLIKNLRAVGLPDLSKIRKSDNLSYGEKRKLHLLVAKFRCPGLLLLDEPTEDLDEIGVKWLINLLSAWQNGLLVVSHDRELLSHFNHFFIIAESGCNYFSGSFRELNRYLEQQAKGADKHYTQKCQMLVKKEEHRAKVLRRRRRKKNYGRISELERCTPRQRLNKKRSMAQVSQGKAAKISQDRIRAFRELTLAGRRALTVSLPLELSVPKIDISGSQKLILLEDVSAKDNQQFLFKHLDLSIGYERFAIVGPNGSGKTTLLNIITDNIKPYTGKAETDGRFGLIAQGGANWMTEGTLLELLLAYSKRESIDEVVQILFMHKFPIALANNPLRSLSPGERVRAAFICLFQQTPEIQILVLDEPTYSLDFVGETSLRSALKAWPGALVVASHNREFLSSIGISRQLVLDGRGSHSVFDN